MRFFSGTLALVLFDPPER